MLLRGRRSRIIRRHPFPGLDCPLDLGDITPEKVSILQDVDAVFIDGLKSWGCMIKYGKWSNSSSCK
jgi:GMP synthase (glutamine-hydrolysing)